MHIKIKMDTHAIEKYNHLFDAHKVCNSKNLLFNSLSRRQQHHKRGIYYWVTQLHAPPIGEVTFWEIAFYKEIRVEKTVCIELNGSSILEDDNICTLLSKSLAFV
jgi:polyphosphate kinase 2 (PPK2 family)